MRQWHLWRPMSLNIHHQLHRWKGVTGGTGWCLRQLKAGLTGRREEKSPSSFEVTYAATKWKCIVLIQKATIYEKNLLFFLALWHIACFVGKENYSFISIFICPCEKKISCLIFAIASKYQWTVHQSLIVLAFNIMHFWCLSPLLSKSN